MRPSDPHPETDPIQMIDESTDNNHNESQDEACRRFVLKLLGTGAFLPFGSGIATAASGPETVFSFDPNEGEFPENITVDKRGNKYLSMPPRGEIRKIDADNQTQSTLATLDPGELGVLGLQVDPQGVLYACLVSFDPNTHGIWRISRDGTTDLFAALDPESFPNDIALAGHSLLVTDSIGGQILRVTNGGTDEWLDDELLDGDGSFDLGFPVGANGIAAAKDGTIYVANTEKGRIVRVPVNTDDSAGTPTTFVEGPDLIGADGIAFDTREHLYVALVSQNKLVRIAPDGSIETLADENDELDAPSDVAFGTTRGEQKDVFITNFAFPEFSAEPDPTLMKLDVGIPGLPIHR